MRISDWSSDVCSSDLTHHTMLHEAFKRFLGGFRHDAHPMSMLVGMLGSMASFYHNDTDYDDPEQRRLAAIRLIAKLPTIAAACHRHSVGWPLRYPRNHLEYVDRFLHMMFEVPSGPLEMHPVAARQPDLLFNLHPYHHPNACSSTVLPVFHTAHKPSPLMLPRMVRPSD